MMFDLPLFLLILVFAIPILMAILTFVSKETRYLKICLTGLGFLMLGLLALAFLGEVNIDPGWTFMGERITFSISSTAIWLYLAVVLILVALIWRLQRTPDVIKTHFQWTLLNLSLSVGFLAFISGQFMMRYIALDIIGLLAALTTLNAFSATSGLRHFIIIFQILRLGDLSLLASILLLNHLTGTLVISDMIAAAVHLPANVRMWIFSGFFLAVLIKSAIWPFGIWLDRARQAGSKTSFWISGLLLPALGYYLLYRIIPILHSGAIFQILVVATALLLPLLLTTFTSLRIVRYRRFTQLSSIMGCFLLAGVVFKDGQYLIFYLLGLVLHRGLLLFNETIDSARLNILSALFPILINGLYIAMNIRLYPLAFTLSWVVGTILLVGWDLFMQRNPELDEFESVQKFNGYLTDESYGGFLVRVAGWLNKKLEFGILTHGIVRMSDYFHQIADWVYQNVEMGMERLWVLVSRKLVQISEGTLRKVEVDAAQKSGDLMDEALNALVRYEEKIKLKTLRWDLAWIPFLLVVILIMLFVI